MQQTTSDEVARSAVLVLNQLSENLVPLNFLLHFCVKNKLSPELCYHTGLDPGIGQGAVGLYAPTTGAGSRMGARPEKSVPTLHF
jgi:hypothetical protein